MGSILGFLDTIVSNPFYCRFRESINSKFYKPSHCLYTKTLNHEFLLTDWGFRARRLVQQNVHTRLSVYEQLGSVLVVILTCHFLLFISFGTFWYLFHFERSLQHDRRFGRDQIRREIRESALGIIAMDLTAAPFAVLQMNGISPTYNSMPDGLWYNILQYPLSLLLMETGIYWLHRMFHSPMLYSWTHKRHHRFILSTPFAAYAFHPLEACIMSLPNLLVPFIIPMSRKAFFLLVMYGNLETIMSHDSGGNFHTMHHLNGKRNFGQLTTIWDRLMDTYVDPHLYLSRPSKRRSRARVSKTTLEYQS